MSVPPEPTSDDFERREEERINKSFARRSLSYGNTLAFQPPKPTVAAAKKQEAPAKKQEAPAVEKKPPLRSTGSRTFLEIERDEARKKKEEGDKKKEQVVRNYVPTWEKVDHGQADSREGVVSIRTINMAESQSDDISKKEEERLRKSLSRN